MSASPQQNVRVRFAPSPTGYLHIGGARTVLFNWLLARQTGGTFILRIEDTDQNRHVEDSVGKILDDLRWLGMTWDEGPEAGGEYGPYFQSQRLDIYNQYAQRLLEAGKAYYALETTEELSAMREAARTRTGGFRYPRPSPIPTIEQGQAAIRAGRPPVIRFRMLDRDIVVHDDILGDVTMTADQLEDFVIVKSDGFPTYHFACVVDDALMKITHVLRGQEHLMNTPRHVALQEAFGFPTPRYAHLPVIFNMDGTKMSKRDKEKAQREGRTPPEIDVHDFRASGYLPEALINFLALLGWSAGDDRERYTLDELTQAFRVERVGRTNARFDREKLMAFNTQWGQTMPSERLAAALRDFARVNASPMAGADANLLALIGEACRGFRTLRDVETKVGFLFIADEALEFDPKAVKKVLEKGDGEGYRVLEALLPDLEALSDWSPGSIERFLEEVCRKRDVQLGKVAQPLRVAATGTTISPSIHDTLALLRKERTVARLRRCIECGKRDGVA